MMASYRYRADPTAGQADMLSRTFGHPRFPRKLSLGLARSRLARSVHHAGWSQLLRLVEEQAEYHGRGFGRIGRFVPSSRVCSACGVSGGPKPLSVRAWTCGNCGAVHDRDVNAAGNILAAGRAERRNACGGDARPGLVAAIPGAAGTLRGAA